MARKSAPKKIKKVTRKPDGEDREFLVEVEENGKVIDAAYFPTEDAAHEWAGNLYNLP